jgi:hypothetical protein
LVKGIGEHGSIERAAASISISIAVLAPKEMMWGERWFRAIRIEQGWILIMFRLVDNWSSAARREGLNQGFVL